MHSPEEKEKWRASYQATTQKLERIRAHEIAAMTDEEAMRRIEALCTADQPWRERPNWSGLVEQQAIFMRGLRNREIKR